MELLQKIQQELKVPKSHTNSFGGYKYRNCEDILEAVKPLLGDGALTISDEIVMLGNRFYVKATAYLWNGDNKKSWSTTAYARESDDKKGMDAAQITGAASSYARKYALNGLFLIDDTRDADSEEPVKAPETSKAVPTTKAIAREAKPSNLTPAQREAAAKARIVDLIEDLNGDKPEFESKQAAQDYYATEVQRYTSRSLPLATLEELESIGDELSVLVAENKNK